MSKGPPWLLGREEGGWMERPPGKAEEKPRFWDLRLQIQFLLSPYFCGGALPGRL